MKALRMFVWMTLLTGFVYPLLITAIASLTMHRRSEGSLIRQGNKVIGSALIGQKFEGERYFWPRPSAVDYNPLPSGGSNLGPTSVELKAQVEKRRAFIASQGHSVHEIPSELLFASASGLDPHISLQTALFQVERISKARNIEKGKVIAEIRTLIEKRRFGFLGVTRVNVLKLNMALDGLKEKK